MTNNANSSKVLAGLLVSIAAIILLIWVTPMQSQRSLPPMEFVSIPAGEFMMGCHVDDMACFDGEKPQHLVKITRPFELGKYEVTQAQWKEVNGGQPSLFAGPDRPVEMVSWSDTQGFISKMNQKRDGFRYRLPTEAEWEYAARAGAPAAPESTPDGGWYDRTAGGQTHAVGQKKPNAWGLYDMSGNVFEWVGDWYQEYSANPGTDPVGPAKGLWRVLRGGSWIYGGKYTRATVRFSNVPTLKYNDAGFRVARERIP